MYLRNLLVRYVSGSPQVGHLPEDKIGIKLRNLYTICKLNPGIEDRKKQFHFILKPFGKEPYLLNIEGDASLSLPSRKEAGPTFLFLAAS